MTPVCRLLLVAALLASGAAGCKEEHDPVGVPFEGIDPHAAADRNKSSSAPQKASASSSADPSSSAPKSSGSGSGSGTGIERCCAALRSAAAQAMTAGSKSNYTAAANACESQRKQIIDGKVTRSQALSAVRVTLLGDAPGACR